MNLIRCDKTLMLKAGAIQGNTLTGDASGIGNLDSYRDVIFPLAFPDETLSDFLARGFVADGHDWAKIVAMPKVAEVRGNKLYTECEFHSTTAAQDVKTVCSERLDNGHAVGLSIGFGMAPTSYKSFISGPALLAYAEANGCDMSLFDLDGIRACSGKCQAILKVDKLFEYSPVAVPANGAAWATGIKNGKDGVAVPLVHFKAQYLGEYAEANACYDALRSLVIDMMWGPLFDTIFGYGDMAGMSSEERLALLDGAYAELGSLSLTIARALMEMIVAAEAAEAAEDAAEGETDDGDMYGYMSAFRSFLEIHFPQDQSAVPAATLTKLADEARSVLDAAKRLHTRALAINDYRVKEGRQISGTNRTIIEGVQESAQGVADTLAQFLLDTQPATTGTAEGKSAAASIAPALLAAHLAAKNAAMRSQLGIK